MAHMGWTQYTLTVSPPGFPSHGVMPTCFFGIFWRLPGANDEDRPRHRWWGTLVQHGSCGAPNPKDSLLHPGSARNKADWRPMLELPPVTAAYYCCNFGHIVLGHSGKRVPWDFCFFFSAILQRFLRPRSFSFHIQHGTPSQFLSNTLTKKNSWYIYI
jgi:hypothetical protein